MRSKMLRRLELMSLATAGLMILGGSVASAQSLAPGAISLFTSGSDWTLQNASLPGTNNGWTPQSGLGAGSIVDTPAADLDGNLINGLGNTQAGTSPGLPGGSGGLQVNTAPSGGFEVVNSPDEAANAGFLAALASPIPEYLAFDFDLNLTALAATTYLQPGFTLNDSQDGYDQLGTQNISNRSPYIAPGTVVETSKSGTVVFDQIDAGGNAEYTLFQPDPYSGPSPTLTEPVGGYTYFQLLMTLNSNYAGIANVDNVRLSPTITPVPEPASLGLLALGVPALLARRRRSA